MPWAASGRSHIVRVTGGRWRARAEGRQNVFEECELDRVAASRKFRLAQTEAELDERATTRNFRVVQTEGSRKGLLCPLSRLVGPVLKGSKLERPVGRASYTTWCKFSGRASPLTCADFLIHLSRVDFRELARLVERASCHTCGNFFINFSGMRLQLHTLPSPPYILRIRRDGPAVLALLRGVEGVDAKL